MTPRSRPYRVTAHYLGIDGTLCRESQRHFATMRTALDAASRVISRGIASHTWRSASISLRRPDGTLEYVDTLRTSD